MSFVLWQLSECIECAVRYRYEGRINITLFAYVDSRVCYQPLHLLKHLSHIRSGSVDYLDADAKVTAPFVIVDLVDAMNSLSK